LDNIYQIQTKLILFTFCSIMEAMKAGGTTLVQGLSVALEVGGQRGEQSLGRVRLGHGDADEGGEARAGGGAKSGGRAVAVQWFFMNFLHCRVSLWAWSEC
jgi:hypothetical protein